MTSLSKPPTLITPTKSKLDEREYGFFTLPNELDVLLISDPKAEKASATCSVNVGAHADPDEALGLFHLIEHLLFMGSKLFPNESEYASYILSHGGCKNASTSAEKTTYYFDIGAAHLEGALERFAQFFICPLFDESCTDRELNAVNSEHNKNIPQDPRLNYELIRHAFDPSHPASRFRTGNFETLRDTPLKHQTNIRQLMLDGHNKYYSSNIMKLVILGKESLGELQDYAIKHFSAVPNKAITPPIFSTNIFPEKTATILERCPIKPQRRLTINWTLPPIKPYLKSTPLTLISHCIGDEGPGSLLSLLKAQRFATGLSSGKERIFSCATTFGLSVDLTELGLLHIPDILRLIYSYINTIIQANDTELFRVCREMQLLHEINFHSREQTSSVSTTRSLVQAMFKYDPKDIITNSNLYYEISLEDIRYFAKKLTIDTSIITIISQDVCRDIKLIGCDIFDPQNLSSKINYTQFKQQYELNKIVSTQQLSLSKTTDTSSDVNNFTANTFETKAMEELNTHFHSKQFFYDRWYKMKYAKYQLDTVLSTYINSGLHPHDLFLALSNEPTIYSKYLPNSKIFTQLETNQPNCENDLYMNLVNNNTILHSILSLPCANPYIPHSFHCITHDEHVQNDLGEIPHHLDQNNHTDHKEQKKNDTIDENDSNDENIEKDEKDEKVDEKLPLSTYVSHQDIYAYPLFIPTSLSSNLQSKYSNSIPNLHQYDSCSIISPQIYIEHNINTQQLHTLIKDKVAEQLIGFDLTHNNNDLIQSKFLNNCTLTSHNDKDRETIPRSTTAATAATAATELKDLSPATTASFVAKDSLNAHVIDSIFGKDVENDPTIPPPPPIIAVSSNPQASQIQKNLPETTKNNNTVQLLYTVDTFFDKIYTHNPTIGFQLIPPQLITVPLPFTVTHFPITINTIKHSPLQSVIQTTPPIECWYKFMDYYKTPNVDLTAVLTLPQFPSRVFLHLYKHALNDFLSESLYPARLTNISYHISSGSNLTIHIRGHRQGVAQCFLTIVSNLRNPLLNSASLARQFDTVHRGLLSNNTAGALQQASNHKDGIVHRNRSHYTESLLELTELMEDHGHTLENLCKLFQTTPMTLCLCGFGNITKPYLIRLAQSAAYELKLREIKTNEILPCAQLVFPVGNNIMLFDNGNSNDNQNAVITQYVCGESSYHSETQRTNNLVQLHKQKHFDHSPLDNCSHTDKIQVQAPHANILTNTAVCEDTMSASMLKNGPKLLDLTLRPSVVWKNMTWYGLMVYNYFFSKLLSGHTFDCLRTKQQLGYIVSSRHYLTSGQYGITISIQSDRPPSYLDTRIEYYIQEQIRQFFTTPPLPLASSLAASLAAPLASPTVPITPPLTQSCLYNDEIYINKLSGTQTTLLAKHDNLSSEATSYVDIITGHKRYDFFFSHLFLAFLLPHLHRHTLLSFYNYFYRGGGSGDVDGNPGNTSDQGFLHIRRKFGVHIIGNLGNSNTPGSHFTNNVTHLPSAIPATTKQDIINHYQEFMPQNVLTEFSEILGFKFMTPSV